MGTFVEGVDAEGTNAFLYMNGENSGHVDDADVVFPLTVTVDEQPPSSVVFPQNPQGL